MVVHRAGDNTDVGHARCVVPAVKTKQNLVGLRGRVWCRLSSERVHSINYTRTRVHHMCYITPRVYSVTTRVRHACTPRVYTTRVHRGRVTGRGTRLYGIAHTGMNYI